MGVTGASGKSNPWFGLECLNGLDLTAYESITFRMKVMNPNALWLANNTNTNDYSVMEHITTGEWIEYTVQIADLSAKGWSSMDNFNLTFQMETPAEGEKYYVFVDQIYATPKA